MTHTMEVSNWLWEWGQDESGCKNPASFLRDELAKVASKRNKKSLSSTASSRNRHNDHDDDVPTIYKARRETFCPYCRRLIEIGTKVSAYNGKTYHFTCCTELMERA